MATRKTDAERIKSLDEQIAALLDRKKAIETKQSEVDRKLISRQNTIVGAWIRANDQATFERVVNALKRSQDRQAFGLDPLGQAPASDPLQQAA